MDRLNATGSEPSRALLGHRLDFFSVTALVIYVVCPF